tara:strand:+ start:312 stop:506 length:195 start_codon:yes stop_codon:yes gene_type:complete
MKAQRGRPVGTTRANGFKVAVDSSSYQLKRNRRYKRIPTVKSDFLTTVGKGLDAFLSPYNQNVK